MPVKHGEMPWRVDVPTAVADEFKKTLDDLGMTQKSGAARLLSWFVAQERDVQVLVLRQLTPERNKELARIILRQMSRKT